jgi:predicted XRE-type DNA-binding protein
MTDDESTITNSIGNVFADLGLGDADEHLLKARVALIVGETIAMLGLTQKAAADRLGIAQPDVSNILRGRLRGFSVDRLFDLARILGNDIEITVRRPAPARPREKQGHLRLLVA